MLGVSARRNFSILSSSLSAKSKYFCVLAASSAFRAASPFETDSCIRFCADAISAAGYIRSSPVACAGRQCFVKPLRREYSALSASSSSWPALLAKVLGRGGRGILLGRAVVDGFGLPFATAARATRGDLSLPDIFTEPVFVSTWMLPGVKS